MHFQIYLTGRAQQVFGLKAKDLTHDSKVSLSENWIELWRCEHLVTDREGAHACIFTNSVTYFSLLVTVADSNVGDLLRNFIRQLFSRLQNEGVDVPPNIQCPASLLRGNPRTLIGVMNQLVFNAEYCLWEREMTPAETENEINKLFYGAPNYVYPEEEFARLIKELPPFLEKGGNHPPNPASFN